MPAIGRRQLDEILSALGELLGVADAHAHLVVIGGSGLVAIGAVTRPTRDVDVVALERDGELISADPLPLPLAEAAAIVARDFGLEPNWLSAGPTRLLDFRSASRIFRSGSSCVITGLRCGSRSLPEQIRSS